MLLSLSARKLSLTAPSWCYPFYRAHLRRLPLPSVRQQEASDSDGSNDSYSEDEYESFLQADAQKLPSCQAKCPADETSPKRGSGVPKKLRKHRRKPREDQPDEDSQPSHPLAESIHANRQVQRLNQHPMSGKKGTKSRPSKTRKSKRQAEAEDVHPDVPEEEPSQAEKENQELQLKLDRLKTRMKLARQPKAKRRKKNTQKTAMEKCAAETAKKGLWKVCKFIKSDKKLYKATKMVMRDLELQEHEGLFGKGKMEAEEAWIAENKDTVRVAVNEQRNYVQQELRELVEKYFHANKEASIPNVDQMMNLIMRNKLDRDTPDEERETYQNLFDIYWNVLIPKVATHNAWGPSKRHHILMSTGKQDEGDPDAPLAVTAEDEAFLVTLWHNCYNKWWYREQCRRNGTEVERDEEDRLTPFTEARGGQKKFGGWKPEAIKFYEKKRSEIHKNREEQGPYVVEVETAALARIREAEGCDEKDAKRRNRRRRPASLMDHDDSDSEDDENFDKW